MDFTGEQGGYRDLLPRAEFNVERAVAVVAELIDDVRERGEEALRELAQRFDGVTPEHLRVPAEALRDAEENLDPELRQSFEISIDRRRRAATSLELDHDPAAEELAPGALVGVRNIPVERVGFYVPGGLAPLASSVVMNVVPAQVAGVSSIAVATPPQKEFGGLPHPAILALCSMLGVDEVYAVGGAQAIGMLAHGVPSLVEPVDMITGPGNIYVVAAKRLVRGFVGIDSEAGPTEIAVVADDTARADFVAADLISQAEHDPLAASVLITDSPRLVEEVQKEVARQVGSQLHAERITASLTGEQSAVVLVRDMDQAVEVADAYGAEHLEIQAADADRLAGRIRHAGAIFVGDYSPVSLGDYSAGSTHVLPTAGFARHSSGLNVRSFMRTVHVIRYSEAALAEIGDDVERFARAENLPGHASAVAVRRQG